MTDPARDPEVFEINLQSLKIREIEEIEEIIGSGFDTAFAAGEPKGKAMRALGKRLSHEP